MPADVVYLNCASRSPMLRKVEDVGHRAVSLKNQPWRIGHDGIEERVRALFARLIGCEADFVALTPSTSYAISLVAHNLLRLGRIGPGDTVLILEDQMSSNVYPWQHVCREVRARLFFVPAPAGGGPWTEAIEASVRKVQGGGGRIAVIAIPQFLWTDGSGPVDLSRIRALCDEPEGSGGGAFRTTLVVDATQSLGVVPFDVVASGVDWLACSVHKWLFGPYGLSCLYAAEEWCLHPQSEPLVHDEHNRVGADGDIVLPFDVARPGYPEEFQPGARRFDAGGRPNPILLPMVEAALTQILAWGGPERVAASIAPLIARVAAGARHLGLTVPAFHGPHIVGVGPGAQDALAGHGGRTARERWADDASAHLRSRGVMVSARVGVLRVAPHVYNTTADVDTFLEALGEFVRVRRGGCVSSL